MRASQDVNTMTDKASVAQEFNLKYSHLWPTRPDYLSKLNLRSGQAVQGWLGLAAAPNSLNSYSRES